jgi:carbamoyl-phosphate synthase large subunit
VHRAPGVHARGRGGGIARSHEELRQIAARGMAASPIGQVLLDQSVLGWGEFELEVMRDHNDNVVIVCSIENLDPMGVHTGDSVTVAPQQTLSDHLYQRLRDQAMQVIRAVGVETGGSNVQFAVHPETEEILVIEMNPRVSRSSALASKATGFPIARSPPAWPWATRSRRSRTTSRAARRRPRSSRRSTTSSSSGRASPSRSSPGVSPSSPRT